MVAKTVLPPSRMDGQGGHGLSASSRASVAYGYPWKVKMLKLADPGSLRRTMNCHEPLLSLLLLQ